METEEKDVEARATEDPGAKQEEKIPIPEIVEAEEEESNLEEEEALEEEEEEEEIVDMSRQPKATDESLAFNTCNLYGLRAFYTPGTIDEKVNLIRKYFESFVERYYEPETVPPPPVVVISKYKFLLSYTKFGLCCESFHFRYKYFQKKINIFIGMPSKCNFLLAVD